MGSQQWYSQYLFQIVLKKIQIEQQLPIINKVTIEIITDTHPIRSKYSPKVKNNVAFFYYEHIKIPFMDFLEIAVIDVNSIKKREEELGRVKVNLNIFENEELVNCKFINRISNTFEIYLHFDINIVRKDEESNPNQTENQYQLSYLEEQFNGKVMNRDISDSRMSEYPLKLLNHLSVEDIDRAKTEINRTQLNSPRVCEQQLEQQLFQSNTMIQFIDKIPQKSFSSHDEQQLLQQYEEALDKIYCYHKTEEQMQLKQQKYQKDRLEIQKLKYKHNKRKKNKNNVWILKFIEYSLLGFAFLLGCFLRIL